MKSWNQKVVNVSVINQTFSTQTFGNFTWSESVVVCPGLNPQWCCDEVSDQCDPLPCPITDRFSMKEWAGLIKDFHKGLVCPRSQPPQGSPSSTLQRKLHHPWWERTDDEQDDVQTSFHLFKLLADVLVRGSCSLSLNLTASRT